MLFASHHLCQPNSPQALLFAFIPLKNWSSQKIDSCMHHGSYHHPLHILQTSREDA